MRLIKAENWVKTHQNTYVTDYYVNLFHLTTAEAQLILAAAGLQVRRRSNGSEENALQNVVDLLANAGAIPNSFKVGALFSTAVSTRYNAILKTNHHWLTPTATCRSNDHVLRSPSVHARPSIQKGSHHVRRQVEVAGACSGPTSNRQSRNRPDRTDPSPTPLVARAHPALRSPDRGPLIVHHPLAGGLFRRRVHELRSGLSDRGL